MGTTIYVSIEQNGQPVTQERFDSLARRTIKIGRLKSSQLRLEDETVARMHAVIELGRDGVFIVDVGSGNGTQLNGAPISRAPVSHGDRITVGATTLVVGIGGPVVEPVAATVASQPAAPGVTPLLQAPMGMPVVAVAPQPTVIPPIQPTFDGGAPTAPQRPSRTHVFEPAVEAKPHPALPPESRLSHENRQLEVRAYWGEMLLSVQHYQEPKAITLGEAKGTDFFISSEGLPREIFPLVRYVDGEYQLTFTRKMEGEVELDGQLHSLESLRGSPRTREDDELEESYCLVLGLGGRALVHWGGATFALRFVAPPHTLPQRFFKSLDYQYVNVLVLSGVAHIAALFTLMLYPPDADLLNESLFKSDADRFEQIIIVGIEKKDSSVDLLEQIEKKVEEKRRELEPPKPEPEEKQIAKVEPRPTKEIDRPIKAVKREKTDAQRRADVARSMNRLMASAGGLGAGSMLSGGGGGTVSGTLENVIGTAGKGSSTAGLAGLGIRGTGPLTGGGIGTSVGVAGIHTEGRAGGGLGYGSRVKIPGVKRNHGIDFGNIRVEGALKRAQIQKVITKNRKQIRYCYEYELQRNKDLKGRILVNWVIGADGKVERVRVRETQMDSRAVERCIEKKIAGWQFPEPEGGGVVEVNYPFVFDNV